VGWIYSELVVVALAAMCSPTTLTFSILALVLGDKPLRTGILFYFGALTATLAIGVIAAFVIGDAAASSDPGSPKTWVAILDLVLAGAVLAYGYHLWRNPIGAEKQEAMTAQMSKVASSPAIAVVGAGAALANPGAYIPIALKSISETDPSATQYVVDWLFFALISLLPLLLALLLLVVARSWALRILGAVRRFLERNLMRIVLVILLLVAVALLRNGIAGLTS
jgi:Sap-like sulfolipid-1-addressing protein